MQCSFGPLRRRQKGVDKTGPVVALLGQVADEPIPLRAVSVRDARPDEEPRCNALPGVHHCLSFRRFCGRRLGLFLVISNSRFLMLPEAAGTPHLASRVLGLSLRRLPGDWLAGHGHPILLALC